MKPLKLMLLSAAAGLVLNACSSEAPVSSQESSAATTDSASTEAGSEKRVFTVGSDMTFPPYEYLDEQGNPGGVDVEIMAKVAEINGEITPKWEDTRCTVFERQVQALCKPEDIVIGLTTSGTSNNINL